MYFDGVSHDNKENLIISSLLITLVIVLPLCRKAVVYIVKAYILIHCCSCCIQRSSFVTHPSKGHVSYCYHLPLNVPQSVRRLSLHFHVLISPETTSKIGTKLCKNDVFEILYKKNYTPFDFIFISQKKMAATASSGFLLSGTLNIFSPGSTGSNDFLHTVGRLNKWCMWNISLQRQKHSRDKPFLSQKLQTCLNSNRAWKPGKQLSSGQPLV